MNVVSHVAAPVAQDDDPVTPDDPIVDPDTPDDPIEDDGDSVEEQITVVGEFAEEQFFARPPYGAIPFTVFNQDGVIENLADFILVESVESPETKCAPPWVRGK